MLLMPLLWISLTGENSGIEMSSSFEAGLKYDNVRNHIYYIFTQPPPRSHFSNKVLPNDSPDLH